MSPAQFEQLVAEVLPPLQRYLRRRADPATADDVIGDVLLVMWRRRADIPEGTELPWCYGVARGCLANARRSDDRRLRLVRRLLDQPTPHVGQSGEDPGLGQALLSLAPADQELLRLWAWEGLGAPDVAQVLGISPNAAAVRLSRARGRLRKALEGAGHEPVRDGEEAPT